MIEFIRWIAAPSLAFAAWLLFIDRSAAPRRFAGAVSLLILFIFGSNLMLAAWRNLSHPAFALAHVENAIYLMAQRWAAGIVPYNDPASYPIITVPYSAAYVGTVALMIRWLGHSVLWPKLVSLLCTVLLAGGLAAVLKALRLSRIACIFGLGAFLYSASPLFLLWGRPDAMLGALSLAALAALSRAQSPLGYAGALLFMLLAALTKQPGAFLYPVALAVLAVRRESWASVALVGLGYPALMGLINFAMDGQTMGYYSYWIFGLQFPFPFRPIGRIVVDLASAFFLIGFIPLVCSLGAGLRLPDVWREITQNRRMQVWWLAAILGTAQMALLSSRVGASANSFLPVMAPLAVVSAWALERSMALPGWFASSNARLSAFFAFALILLYPLLYHNLHAYHSYFSQHARVPAMLREVEDCGRDGTCLGALFVVGAKPHPAPYDESIDLSAAVSDRLELAHAETALMDFLAAGHPLPESLAQDLARRRWPKIIVEKGYQPFALQNHYYLSDIPLAPAKRQLYPDSVRTAFADNYKKMDSALQHFDLWTGIKAK